MVKIDEGECIGCGICADNCAQKAITMDDVAKVDNSLCVDCGACVESCPASAITE